MSNDNTTQTLEETLEANPARTLFGGTMSGDSFDWVTGAGADLADLGADGEDPCGGDRYCSCELCRSKPPERYTTSSMRAMAMWLSDAVCQ